MTEAAPRRWGAAAVLAAVVLALAVRVGWHELLPYYDEIRPLKAGTLTDLLFEAETGVNPPLYRWWMTRPSDPWDGLWLGRWTATVGSTLAVLASAALARALSGSWTAAAGAALALATLPDAVRNGVESRAYGLTALAVTVHLLGLVTSERRAGRAAAAGTAALVPWLHYSAVPWLGLTAVAAVLRRPKDALIYAPAVLTTLPLALLLPGRTAEREPPRATVLEVVQHTLGLGLGADGGTADLRLAGAAAAVVALVLLAALLRGRALDGTARLAVGSALAWPASVAVVGSLQLVRPPVFGLAAHVLLPVVLALLARASPIAAGSLAALITGLGAAALPAAFENLQVPRRAEALAAEQVRQAVPSSPTVGIHPATDLVQLAFLARDAVERFDDDPEACAPWPRCVPLDDGLLVGVQDLSGPLPPVVVITRGGDALPSTCRITHADGDLKVARCPSAGGTP